MENITQKSMIFKNTDNGTLKKKILVLKKSAPEGDSSVIREAEKIVEKYMGKKTPKEKEKKLAPLFFISLGAALLSAGMLVVAFFV